MTRLLEGLLASHQFLMPAEYGFGFEDQDGLSQSHSATAPSDRSTAFCASVMPVTRLMFIPS